MATKIRSRPVRWKIAFLLFLSHVIWYEEFYTSTPGIFRAGLVH